MNVQTISKGTEYASLGIKVIRRDGSIVDFGTVSNLPVIGRLQKWLVNYRIKKYKRSMKNESR